MDPFNSEFQRFISEQVFHHRRHRVRQLGNQIVDFLSANPPPSLQREPVPMFTSSLTGRNWVMELINGHPDRMHNAFRMRPPVFLNLCQLLHEHYDLRDGRKIDHREIVAIFLFICAQGTGFRQAAERFQHSLSTISKSFQIALGVMDTFARNQIQFDFNAAVHPHILNNTMYYPHFRDCIGGLDGTHVHACLPHEIQVPFIGRSGTTTQNVLGICDFDMCFTYCSASWEGSMHDTRILGTVMRGGAYNFPTPPFGKYYLVDSGYPNMTGFLAPYKGERYHLNAFQTGPAPQSAEEIFNRAHSSLRSVIERSFGVWKERWHILDRMSFTDIKVQGRIVAATMALHNFIRRTDPDDPGFTASVPRVISHVGQSSASTEPIQMCADAYMDTLRDNIRYSMCGM